MLVAPGETQQQADQRAVSDMDQSKIDAAVVVLSRLEGYPKHHGAGVLVESVASGCPADGVLFPGDVITSVNGTDVPDPTARRLYLGTHNYRAGRAAGDLVKEILPQGGKIAIFVGDMASQNAQERRQAFEAELDRAFAYITDGGAVTDLQSIVDRRFCLGIRTVMVSCLSSGGSLTSFNQSQYASLSLSTNFTSMTTWILSLR